MSSYKNLYWRLVGDRTEELKILDLLRTAGANATWKILDIGCGLGRNLRALQQGGFCPVGVDVNADTLEQVRSEGFECYKPDDPALENSVWDVLIMSHIIEHFDYQGMVKMVESYLRLLRPGGYLIIATPLINSRFYEDFDHVKPYHPEAIHQVFGRRGSQVQSQSHYQLELDCLWFRRSPLRARNHLAFFRLEMSFSKVFWGAINLMLKLACKISFRLIARTDAWVGLYKLK